MQPPTSFLPVLIYPLNYYAVPFPSLTPLQIDPYTKDFSGDLNFQRNFEKMKNSEKLLSADEHSDFAFPTIIVNLGQLASHLQKTLHLGKLDSNVYLIKDSAAQVIDGPLSTTWHLAVWFDYPTDGQNWKNSYEKEILKSTIKYVEARVQEAIVPSSKRREKKDPPPIAPALMKSVYKLKIQRTFFGWRYELGPDIIINFSNNLFWPRNASSLEGWQIPLFAANNKERYRGRCIVGDRILTSEEWDKTLSDVSKRHFVAAKVPELFIPMLNSLGHGATITRHDHGLMQDQLASIIPEELQNLWEEFQQSHQKCLRTQWIHFLNFLRLVQDSVTLCKKVAQLGVTSFTSPEHRVFAQYIAQHPNLTADLLNVICGICLYQITRPKQNKILHAFGMPFDHYQEPRPYSAFPYQKPRPYAAFPCNLGIRYLALAAPNQDGSPEDIVLRFFKGIRELSNLTFFKPILEVLGIDSLGEEQDGNSMRKAFRSAWQEPCLKTILAVHYPQRGFSTPRSLMDIDHRMAQKESTTVRILTVSQKNAIVLLKSPEPQHEVTDSPKTDSPLSSNTSQVEEIFQESDSDSPGKFILLLKALSQGDITSPTDWVKARLQLLDMTPESLRELWTAFQQSPSACSRTQWIQFLNLLLLVQSNPALCQKVAQLFLDIQAGNLTEGNDLAQNLLKHPEITPTLLAWIHGVCLYTWATQDDQCQDSMDSPRPYARFLCEGITHHLTFAPPEEKDGPEEVALRFFKSMDTLSQQQAETRIPLVVLKPILAILGLCPLMEEGAEAMKQVMEDIVDAWQKPRMKGFLQKYFPDSRPIYRPLTNRLKKQKRFLEKTQNLASKIQCEKFPIQMRSDLCQRNIRRHPSEREQKCERRASDEGKQPSKLMMSNESQSYENQRKLQQWKELVQAAQGDKVDYKQIVERMIEEWPVVKENLSTAQEDFIAVLLRSGNLGHFKRALSLAIKAKQPITSLRKQDILTAMISLVPTEWPDKLINKVGIFIKSLCQSPISEEIVDRMCTLLKSLPPTKLQLLAPSLFKDSPFTFLPTEERLPTIQTLTSSSILSGDWMTAIQYYGWAKIHLTPQDYERYSSAIKSQIKEGLQLKKILSKQATSQDIQNALISATRMLSFYQTLDTAEARKLIKFLFKHAFDSKRASFMSELFLLYQTAEDLELFPKSDSAIRGEYCYELIVNICKRPLDDHARYIIGWLDELKTHTDFKNEQQVSRLSEANVLYMKRLIQKVLSSNQRDAAIFNLIIHFETYWVPLTEVCKSNKMCEIASRDTQLLCIFALYIPGLCRILQQAVERELVEGGKEETSLESKREEPPNFASDDEIVNKPPFTLLTSDEKLLVIKEAYGMRMDGTAEEYARVCSFDGPNALVPLIANLIVLKATISSQLVNEHKKANSPQKRKKLSEEEKKKLAEKQKVAEDSVTCCLRMIESAKSWWRGTNALTAGSKLLNTALLLVLSSVQSGGGSVRILPSSELKNSPQEVDEEHE